VSSLGLGNWLMGLFQDPDEAAASASPTLADKSYVFDDLAAENVRTPSYLLSAVLSGLNILPPESTLRSLRSQRGRRVQYASYRSLELVFTPSLQPGPFESSSRLVESVSLRSNADVLEQGTLRVFKFQLTDADAAVVDEGIAAHTGGRGQGISVSNSGGYHSEVDVFADGSHALLARLCESAVKHAEERDCSFGAGVSRRRRMQDSAQCEAWVNVNTHGAWNSLHTHSGSTWSGIYYSKVPSDDVTRPGGRGNLLLKPSPHLTEVKTPLSKEEQRRLNAQPDVTSGQTLSCCDSIELQPKRGMLLVFPAYLQHAVLPLFVRPQFRRSEAAERVSLAFNFAEELA
jgi:Putative 2OG-Fe(II) oxygenase